MESLIGGAYVQWGQSHSVMSGSSLVARAAGGRGQTDCQTDVQSKEA